jgi:hypothetical protein
MEENKLYIITGGDSFSTNTQNMDNMHSLRALLTSTNINYFNHLEYDYRSNGINAEFFNLGYPSAGNHYILDTVKDKVNELLSNGIEAKNIIVFTQFTYFMRNLESLDTEKIIKKEHIADYYQLHQINYSKDEIYNIVYKHLTDILDFGKWLDEKKDIKFKFFFPHDVFNVKNNILQLLLNRNEKIKQKILELKPYFLYNDPNTLAGIYENYIKSNHDNIWSAYVSNTDLHYNSIVYYYWYIEKIKPFIFPQENVKHIIEEEELEQQKEELKRIFLKKL